MALRNPKLFGLNVFSALADVVDKEQSLNSLNLSSRDLDIIRGSQNAGASSGDWISFSRLIDPLYRTLDRYKTDSETYGTLLDTRAGTERTLFGNLNINGILSGNAVRYRYLDGTGPSATVKIADISTSRVSAWSSSASPATSTSPISYGAQVSIRSGGALQFGTQSGTTGPRLQTSLAPQAKEFASEFPTSKITCTIGGQSVVLYAMKGIPLIFTGFFRNLNASIRLTSLINNTSASWKIVETANPNNFTNFANRGNITSSINFRSSVSRERYIQFYYNPDNISTITLTSANITELPAVKLQNATELNFSNNQLRNFPDFTFISPTLQSLNLINNPLSQSEIETERKLNSAVVNKIPTTLRELYLGQTFFGSIPQNIIANRFPQLRVLNLSRTGDTGPYYHPDVDDANCELPNVPNTCETYSVSRNDFRRFGNSVGIASSVPDLTNLISLDVARNWNLGVVGPFSISGDNNVIQSINSHHTNLPLPTGLSGKNSFTTLYHYRCRSAGPLVSDSGFYIYDNCNSLSTLHLYGSNVTGRLPKFTNAALSYLDLRLTNLTGGGPDGDETFVIPERTFEKCTNLVYMLIQSVNLLFDKEIHPNAFSYSPNLYYLWYISYGRTIGDIPNLTLNSNLQFLVLHYNKFTGTMPSFASNPNIYYVDITYNALSGAIPPLKNLQNLNRLLVYNNQFTSLSTFSNLSNLQYFYAQSNKLSGEIPSFAGCPNLLYLILFNNSLTDYKTGGLATNYRLSYLDLSGNSLTGQAINQIIADLLLNYNTVNRGGVTVNLRGQTGNVLPSGVALDSIDILRSKGWSIVYN
jgi:Leucine-rich repeat (LRR) protein